MNRVADENVDRQIVEVLRAHGHLVTSVAETSPGVPDEHVLRLVADNDAILITADKDFGEYVFRQKRAPKGVVFLRLAGWSPAAKAELVHSVVAKHGAELEHSITVVTPRAVRIRLARRDDS
jgi:predicted nuclease of predicted toxin-antitoxin system